MNNSPVWVAKEEKVLRLTLDTHTSPQNTRAKSNQRIRYHEDPVQIFLGRWSQCPYDNLQSSNLAKLGYGCQVYGSASDTSLKMLDAVHHMGIRLCTQVFRSSPVASLYAESREPSLGFRRDIFGLQPIPGLVEWAQHLLQKLHLIQ